MANKTVFAKMTKTVEYDAIIVVDEHGHLVSVEEDLGETSSFDNEIVEITGPAHD
ncbi:hypothetical protein KLEB273_gp104 [Bacillus phage vB_BauM_KLEB27-3]|nr:hypothetical protein KLEB273_gp104 [Bacillus phage vB_BauM_KLEB27-3]